jgi:hypothetical protein
LSSCACCCGWQDVQHCCIQLRVHLEALCCVVLPTCGCLAQHHQLFLLQDNCLVSYRHGQDHLLMRVEFPSDYPYKPFFMRLVSPRWARSAARPSYSSACTHGCPQHSNLPCICRICTQFGGASSVPKVVCAADGLRASAASSITTVLSSRVCQRVPDVPQVCDVHGPRHCWWVHLPGGTHPQWNTGQLAA